MSLLQVFVRFISGSVCLGGWLCTGACVCPSPSVATRPSHTMSMMLDGSLRFCRLVLSRMITQQLPRQMVLHGLVYTLRSSCFDYCHCADGVLQVTPHNAALPVACRASRPAMIQPKSRQRDVALGLQSITLAKLQSSPDSMALPMACRASHSARIQPKSRHRDIARDQQAI